MNFTPFSFLGTQAAPTIVSPNDLTSLSFWVDFSDTNFLEIVNTGSADYVNRIYSKVSGSTSHQLDPKGVNNTSNFGGPGPAWMLYTSSLSNPSKNCAKVVQRPSIYWATNWNSADNNAIVVGPKTATTDYPDSTEFYVLNRGTISTAGYISARFGSGTDRGVVYNLSSGTPQTDIISYDANSPAYLYYGTTNTSNTILTRVNNGATATIYNGRSQTATGAKNDTQDRTRRQFNAIGIYSTGGTTSTVTDTVPINTHYCEIVIYNRVLSETERSSVWNYLSNKWNITL